MFLLHAERRVMVTNSKSGIFELKRYLGSLSQSMDLPHCTILIYHQIINIFTL
ncbi:hypothetical protein Hanom_Chr06g00522241 [Helianthus anomalus]